MRTSLKTTLRVMLAQPFLRYAFSSNPAYLYVGSEQFHYSNNPHCNWFHQITPVLNCRTYGLCQALAFMRTYSANDEALSRVLGGSDPKTIHKYMWPYIDSIFELDEVLVCILFCCVSLLNEPLLTILIIQLNLSRLYLKTGRWGSSEMTVFFQWMAQTFAS